MARTEFVAVDSPALARAVRTSADQGGADRRAGWRCVWLVFSKDEVATVLPQRIEYHRQFLRNARSGRSRCRCRAWGNKCGPLKGKVDRRQFLGWV